MRDTESTLRPQHFNWYHSLTYPEVRIKDFTLDVNLPKLQYNDHIPITPNAHRDLGTLNTLPLELLHEIIHKLDIRTLTDLRHVNRRAMWLVESDPQYKTIRKHAFNALRGILCIETGRWITCEMLFNRLCTAECEQCGDFGGYLTSLLANGFASSVWWRINDIYHCGISMQKKSLGLTVRSFALYLP